MKNKKNVFYFLLLLTAVSITFFTSPNRTEAMEENQVITLSEIIGEFKPVKIQKTEKLTMEELEQEIISNITYQLKQIKNGNNYHLREVNVPKSILESKKEEVQLVFIQDFIGIPLVELISVDLITWQLEKKHNQFTLKELASDPSLLIEKIEGSTKKNELTFEWVNEFDKKIDLENWQLIQEENTLLFLKGSSKEDKQTELYEEMTHSQLADYLIRETSEVTAKDEVKANTIENENQETTFSIQDNHKEVKQSRAIPTIAAEYGLPIILKNELEDSRTEAEVKSIINKFLHPIFKNASTGENYTDFDIVDFGDLSGSSLSGTTATITYEINVGNNEKATAKKEITVLPASSINHLNDWTEIPLDSDLGVIENPINASAIGFNKRGVKSSSHSPELGYNFRVDTNRYFMRGDQPVFVPFENNGYMYPGGNFLGINGWGKNNRSTDDMNITQTFFLRHKSGKKLKQIFVEANKDIISVLDLSLKTNFSYEVMMSTFNTSLQTRELAVLEYGGDIDFFNYSGPTSHVYKEKQGFYFKDKEKSTNKDFLLTYILRNNKGEWLSDYDRMIVGKTTAGVALYKNDYFENFMRPGFEDIEDLGPDDSLIQEAILTPGYQLGADYKRLTTDESIKVGYQLVFGEAFDTLELDFKEDAWDYYHDEIPTTVNTDYDLDMLPVEIPVSGVINGVDENSEEKHLDNFESQQEKKISGNINVKLNDFITLQDKQEEGTVQKYQIPVAALVTSDGKFKNLGSEEELLTITSYSFGATPKGTTVKLNSTWNLAPEELLTNKAVVPGNNVVYEYTENPPIDTKKKGLHWVKVKMTDKTANKTKTYDVPVNVVEDAIPDTGITLIAEDVTFKQSEIEQLSDSALNNQLLIKSNSAAWDNVTGSQKGIIKKVTSKTVEPTSDPGDYKATIAAQKNTTTETKTINVKVLPDIEVDINTSKLPKSTDLGTDIKAFESTNLKEWVKVTSNGNPVDESDYSVTLTKLDTSRINDKNNENGELKIISGKAEILLPINIPVVWGNSVAIGGSGTNLASKESAMALTLHEDASGTYLSMSYGNLPDNKKNTALNAGLGNKVFVQLAHYKTSSFGVGENDALEVTDGPSVINEVMFSLNGNQKPADAISQFGTNGRLDVAYGDVLRLYTEDPYQKVLYSNSVGPAKPIQGLPLDETTFGVLTKDGFHPTYLGHMETDGVSIPAEETENHDKYEAHYQANFNNYVQVPKGVTTNPTVFNSVKALNFKKYPKTSLAVGQSDKGSVFVTEPTTINNQYIKYAYDLDFVGSGPELAFAKVPAEVNFGQPKISSKTQQVKQVKTNDKWEIKVQDSQETRDGWQIQMKAEPFKTGTQGNFLPLKGAELSLQTNSVKTIIGTEFKPVYINDNPIQGTNTITWQGADGFNLEVPSGFIEVDADYTTTVDILLSNVPNN